MNNKRIDVLDGVRAFAIAFVVWFHFWQQSWLTPYVNVPAWITKITGIHEFNLAGFVRYGFVFVDLLILLSAVCNFYPYARSIVLKEEWPDWKTFYKKRAIRILPSYLLAVAYMFLVANIEHCYSSVAFAVKDIVAHLFCLRTFSPELMMWSPLNGVLWTVQIEVLFYLLMPWIAKLFRRFPVVTLGSLWLCSLVTVRLTMNLWPNRISFVNNMMFSYATLYANGLLLCMVYLCIQKTDIADSLYSKILAVILFLGSVLWFNNILHRLGNDSAPGGMQGVQLESRIELSFVYMIFILAIMFLPKWMQLFWSNPLARYISAISYNLYLWHQFIAVKLKQYHIPFWEGDTPPNITGDRAWMWKYQILIILVSLFVATILTYGFERPVAQKCRKKHLPEQK